MTDRIRWGLGAGLALLVASSADAQMTVLSPADAEVQSMSTASMAAQAPSTPSTGTQAEPGFAMRFLRDVGSDYKNFFSADTAIWLGVGGAAALAVHPADEHIKTEVEESNPDLDGGAVYGSQLLQVPVAVAWWIAGAAAGSERNAATGRDLLRAQIAVFSWTYAIKYATNRTRPNGDPRSFPSGHATASFATAMVLQEHFGWKLGLPAFLAAGFTAASRVTDNQHWASDVVFGAALGMVCGRTVTVKLRETKMTISPLALRRGGGVLVTALR